MLQPSISISSPQVLPNDPPLPAELSHALNQHQAGHLDEAEELYRLYLHRHPSNPRAMAFLGALSAQKGDYRTADQLLSQAIRSAPELADPRFCRGVILIKTRQSHQAITPLSYAAALGHPEARKTLSALTDSLGADAETRSAQIMAGFYRSQGRMEPALESIVRALTISPHNLQCWQLFAQILARTRFQRFINPELMKLIDKAFDIKSLDHKHIAGAAISALMHDKCTTPLREAAKNNTLDATLLAERIKSGVFNELFQLQLANKILTLSLVCDLDLEKLLTSLRHAFLLYTTESPEDLRPYLPFLNSLAQQCFLNQYVWQISSNELDLVEKLKDSILFSTGHNENVAPSVIAIAGCYFPLYSLDCIDSLRDQPWPDSLSDTIRIQIDEPLREQLLCNDIPSAVPASTTRTRQLQTQYERAPYPRWINAPVQGHSLTLTEYLARQFPHLQENRHHSAASNEILVAGCGTGLAAIHLAQHIDGSQITAMDLSKPSLAYAMRKSEETGINNIQFIQGDILELDRMGREYNHINCYGVLHHLPDFRAALQQLAACMKPGGTMQIGIYSEQSQRPLDCARRLIEQGNYSDDDNSVRRCRQDLARLRDDRMLLRLTLSPSFYSLGDFRNLIFSYETSYITLKEVSSTLGELGLQFIGFQHSNPAIVNRYRQRFPDDQAMTSLEYWQQFELEHPETFSDFYNFWVRKPG